MPVTFIQSGRFTTAPANEIEVVYSRSSASTLSQTTNAHSNIIQGDIVLFSVVAEHTTTGDNFLSAAPGGQTWTQLGTEEVITGNWRCRLYYCIYSGHSTSVAQLGNVNSTPNGTVSTTGSITAVFRGVDQSTPIDATTEQGSSSTTGATTFTADSITAATAGAMVVTVWLGRNDDNGAGTTGFFPAAQAPWTEIIRGGSNQGNDTSWAINYQTVASAGPVTPQQLTVGAANQGAAYFTIALRPAGTALKPPSFVRKGLSIFATGSQAVGDPTSVPDNTADAQPVDGSDLAVIVYFAHSSFPGQAVLSTPSGWAAALSQDGGDPVAQVFTRTWNTGMTWPTLALPNGGGADAVAYTLILRGIDLASPVSAATHNLGQGSSTTITYPAVTPSHDDCIILRTSMTQVQSGHTAHSSNGVVVVPAAYYSGSSNGWADNSTAVATYGEIEHLVGGSGASTGTKTATINNSTTKHAVTIAFKPA